MYFNTNHKVLGDLALRSSIFSFLNNQYDEEWKVIRCCIDIFVTISLLVFIFQPVVKLAAYFEKAILAYFGATKIF